MAYTFDKLTSELDDKDDNQQDIFQNEGPQTFSLAGAPQQDPSQAQAGDKKTEGGLLLTGGGQQTEAAQAAPAAPKAAPRGQTEQRQAVLSKQKAQVPMGLRNLGESLREKEQDLEQSATDYLGGFNQQDFGLGQETIEKAIGGDDQDALDRVSGLLRPGAPGALPDYRATETSTPLIDQIQTEGGLERYLRRQAGPQYTTGEAGFDVASLVRDPTFQAGKSALGRRAETLRGRETELADTLGGEAAEILAAKQAEAQEGLRGYLTGEQGEIQDDITRDLEARQAALPQARELALKSRAQSELNQLALDNPQIAEYLKGDLGVTASDYLGGQDPLQRQQFTSEAQATRFNRIMDLLGEGGDSLTAGAAPGVLSDFDATGYRDALFAAGSAGLEAEQARIAAAEQAAAEQAAAAAAESDIQERLGTPEPIPVTSIPQAAPVGTLNLPDTTTTINPEAIGGGQTISGVTSVSQDPGRLQIPLPPPPPPPPPTPGVGGVTGRKKTNFDRLLQDLV